MVNIEENKEKFISLLNINNLNEIINYLDESDFFIAPASINYHGNYDGGLCEHSLYVYDNIFKLSKIFINNYSEKELTLVSLLHDVCKIGIYQKQKRDIKKKDENGNDILNNVGKVIWEKIDSYIINDSLPLGHGEKSVIILMNYFNLTKNEIMAIRWHMGGYDDLTKTYIGNLTANNAFNNFPIITLLHMADLSSIFLKLKENKEIQPDLNFISFQTDEDLTKEMY